VGSAIRFLTVQDGRMRVDTNDDLAMEPTMYGRLATHVITAESRRPDTPDRNGGDNEHMWSLEFTSACVGELKCRVRRSYPRRVRALHKHGLSDTSPDTSDGGSRRLRRRSPIKKRAHAQSLDGMSLLVPFSAFGTVSNRARPESRRFVYRLSHDVLPLFASDPPTTAASASYVTSFMSTKTPYCASRSVAFLDYYHPESSPLFVTRLLVILAICRLKLC
jgi:hypothetical protein